MKTTLPILLASAVVTAMGQTNEWKPELLTNNAYWYTNSLFFTNGYSTDRLIMANYGPRITAQLNASGIVTNLVIDQKYEGTISIGTNFYTVKDLIVKPL